MFEIDDKLLLLFLYFYHYPTKSISVVERKITRRLSEPPAPPLEFKTPLTLFVVIVKHFDKFSFFGIIITRHGAKSLLLATRSNHLCSQAWKIQNIPTAACRLLDNNLIYLKGIGGWVLHIFSNFVKFDTTFSLIYRPKRIFFCLKVPIFCRYASQYNRKKTSENIIEFVYEVYS